MSPHYAAALRRVGPGNRQRHAYAVGAAAGERDTLEGAAAHAKAAAVKLASRSFQRSVTPEEPLKEAQDVAESPPTQKVTGYVKGQTIGRWKGAIRDPLLIRLFSGFGVLLPAAGLYFSAKNVRDEARRTLKEGGDGKALSAASFAAATTVDAALTWTVATSLAQSVRSHVPLEAPAGDAAHWVAWYWTVRGYTRLRECVRAVLTDKR